jgi:outer membrane protein W
MKIHNIVLATGLLLVAGSTAALAKDSSWTLRFYGAIVQSSAEGETSVGDGIVSSIDAGGGVGIGGEYRLNNRLGLEVSAIYAGLQFDSSLSGRAMGYQSSASSMLPLTFAVPFHFGTGSSVDFFVAPTFSIVRYEDVETFVSGTQVGSSIDVHTDTALGAALGIDVPFGKEKKWAFSTGLRYMKTGVEEVDVDPVIVTLGAAYHF